MNFIGLDLAWKAKNPTGAAVVELDGAGGRFLESALLGDDEAILAFVDRHSPGGPCVVGIDAPLTVPNATGRRPGETELHKIFGKYQAGAHPANRARLADPDGTVRGERLVEGLSQRGFLHDPRLPPRQPVRRVLEVYPHPAMVALFGLARTLKYKRKRQGAEAMYAAWAHLHGHLRALESAEPALRGLDTLLSTDVTALRGKGLKNHEDQVDAVLCAYIALYAWYWGGARTELFGTLDGGYILTPTLPERWGAG